VKQVPTEASAMAIRCFRGDTGTAEIRRGLRTVSLTPLGGLTIFLDPQKTVNSAARLAKAVMDAADMEEANGILNSLGVRTELDLERETAAQTR
jgi:hypothetical protein